MKLLRFLPNIVTLANLFCGCLGIIWAIEGQIQLSVYMIWLAAVMDFADGLVARLLKVNSELGKQLDSLADVVSFGLLPSVILFVLFSRYHPGTYWPYFAFLIVLFSALRLAKFNIDPDQSSDFTGLPVPANALLIGSFPALIEQNIEILRPGLESPLIWLAIIVLLAYLLVSKFKLFGLKFNNLTWEDNKFRFVFIALTIITLLIWQLNAIPVIVLMYLLLSILRQYRLG